MQRLGRGVGLSGAGLCIEDSTSVKFSIVASNFSERRSQRAAVSCCPQPAFRTPNLRPRERTQATVSSAPSRSATAAIPGIAASIAASCRRHLSAAGWLRV